MALLNPLALLLLPLVGVLLWLNSRRPRDRQSVANLYLWQQAAMQAPARLRITRAWRHWLLVLQIAFMLAAIAALARPAVSWRPASAAFVFDLSASMAARAEGGTRAELAKARALSLLAGVQARWVRVISAEATAIDRGRFRTTDRRLETAIRSQTATAGGSAILDGIRLARLADGANTPVYVFSDRAAPRAPLDDGVHWVQVGTAGENVAITTLSARRDPARRTDDEVLVGVRNLGVTTKEVSLELRQNEAVVANERIAIAPGATRTLVRTVPAIDGILAASFSSDDDLAIDNQRLVVAPPATPLRVLLRTAGNRYLEQALAANPDVALDVVAPADRAASRDHDVVVCDGCTDLPPEGSGIVWLRAAAANAPGPLSPLIVSQTGHPVARSLDLNDVSAAITGDSSAPADGDVVVRAGGQPAVVAYEQSGRRVVDIRIALRGSNLPLSVGFPVLLANATDWVAARHRNPSAVVAGEPLRWNVPAGTRASDVRVVAPDGRELPVTIEGANLSFTETSRPGVYLVRGLVSDRRFVVNADSGESDLSVQPFEAAGSPDLTAGQSYSAAPREAAIWLTLIAMALAAVEWWAFRKQSPGARAFAGRAVTLALLTLAAANISVPAGERALDVMFVLDRSDSIAPRADASALARLRRMTTGMRSSDRAGLVVFGLDAVIERLPASAISAGAVSSKINSSGTNIEAAIDLARAALPDRSRGRIVLLSDGRETAGVAAHAAARAAAEHVRIDTIAVDSGAAARPLVTHVTAPADAQVGEPFAVRVDVEGRAGARERLLLYRDGERVAEQNLVVPAAGSTSVTFGDSRATEGSYTYSAAIATDDDEIRAAGTVVAVSGRPAVLYVGPSESIARPLAAHGFAVERIAATAAPADVAALRRFSAVVLDHVVPAQLTAAQTTALGAYVEQTGGGLLVLGDARTLDPSGYASGPLGRLLPVDFRPRAGRRDPAMGLVVVFDKSGSMADRAEGIPKIEIAREAAKRAFDVVPPGDSIGVVAFDATPRVAVPFGPARDARAVVEQLRAIEPGGSTAIAPAVTMAVGWLRSANVTKRYILLVSDGRTSPADAERLRAAVRDAGVELSVVAIGADADRPFLTSLAESSGGRAFFPDDARMLPAIVAREATRAAGGSVVAETFTVRGAAHPVLAGIDRGALPTMTGYVVGAVKPEATAVLSSHLDDPVLAGWQAGLGRVAVFTSDLASPWTTAFQRWPAYAPLWAQTVRWLGRRMADAMLSAEVLESAGSATLVVTAERPDGQAANLIEPRVRIRVPGGDERTVALSPLRPGRYEASIPATETGTYLIAVSGRDESGADARVVRGFYWSADRERRTIGADRVRLAELAAIAGGRVLAPDDNPFERDRPRGAIPTRSWLLVGALLAFLIDVATRRGLRRTQGGRPAAPSREAAA